MKLVFSNKEVRSGKSPLYQTKINGEEVVGSNIFNHEDNFQKWKAKFPDGVVVGEIPMFKREDKRYHLDNPLAPK